MSLKLKHALKSDNLYRNDHDNQIDNPTNSKPFSKILNLDTDRRSILKGSVATAIGSFFVGMSSTKSAVANSNNLIGFNPVRLTDGSGATPSISSDYQYQVLIPWGEPLKPGGPEFSYPPTSADQAKQIGIGHDGMTFFPDTVLGLFGSEEGDTASRLSNWSGKLAINHEFGNNNHVLAKSEPESMEDVRVSQHAHGVSIVAIKKDSRFGDWKVVDSKDARRIHVNTPVTFSGPVAESDLIKTKNGNIPLGTVNNCSNGSTPWGTYLTCEENFNGYFGATNLQQSWIPTEEQERYGFSENGFGYGWHNYDKRFDLSDPDYHNEENRFGWIVEIDPHDATQTPVKRTALGRFKHEGVEIVVGRNGRIVAYMGDDQRFDYIYKFVSDDNWWTMRQQGRDPLDEGKLYVARFNEDGSGDWLELTIDNPNLSARFSSQAEVLTYSRLAADILGATPMDRPEWISVAPNKDVYCTLTNNSQRTVADAVNPLAPNSDGHIIRWRDTLNHTGDRFAWEVFLVAEETHGTEESFSDPDGLWADPDGRIFIQTDGGQKDGLNNQMLVTDQGATEIKRLFTGVTGDEITGITVTPNRRTMFINMQHPGNGDPSITNFPAEQDGVTVPRDCTIVITRKDGGIIGS